MEWEEYPAVGKRVVTGLNEEGKSTIISNTPVLEIPGGPGQMSLIWRSDELPVSNEGNEEASAPFVGTMIQQSGVVFMVIRSSPRVPGESEPLWHATNTLDCVYVAAGRMQIELEDGSYAELGPGDFVVDRGVVHRWRVIGDEPSTMIATVVKADPVGEGFNAERDNQLFGQYQ